MRTWPTFEEEGRSEDCSASCVAEKTDLILCTESPKCGLTESADRSIARKAEQPLRWPQSGRHVALDKQCLLIEVRSGLRLVASSYRWEGLARSWQAR
jgi:hypothetical protein